MLYTPNTSNDIIAISIYSKGGQLTEKTPGTANLVSSVMMKGTKIILHLNYHKFSKITE